MSDDTPTNAPLSPDDHRDPIFEALWQRALDAWGDEKTHAAILDYALRAQQLADLAGRYRALQSDVDKGAIAKKKSDAIVVAATQLLFSTKTPARPRVPWPITLSAAAIFVVVATWLSYLLFSPR